MSESSNVEPKLKVVSLPRQVVVVKSEREVDKGKSVEEEVILAPFLIDECQVIEDLSKLVKKVSEEFSKACDQQNLKWEAELELGMEFGVKFTAKLKICPKS